MSSNTTTPHQGLVKPQTSTNIATKNRNSRKIMVHQPVSPSPPDDWVLYPQDIVTEKHSSVRHDPKSRHVRTVDSSRASPSLPKSRVMELNAVKMADAEKSQAPKPFIPSTCLNHMSARNCTTACFEVEPLHATRAPPKAPSPPRLQTPDLSDFGEDDVWSCCKSSEASASDSGVQDGDDFWNEMSAQALLTAEAKV